MMGLFQGFTGDERSMLKVNPIRSKKAMAAANGRSCVNCGTQDGTVVRAHYTGLRQQLYGKGRGIKGHDCIAADLCQRCHSKFDQMKMGSSLTSDSTTIVKKMDQSEQFLHLCALTLVRDIEEGVLTYA